MCLETKSATVAFWMPSVCLPACLCLDSAQFNERKKFPLSRSFDYLNGNSDNAPKCYVSFLPVTSLPQLVNRIAKEDRKGQQVSEQASKEASQVKESARVPENKLSLPLSYCFEANRTVAV